MSENVITCVSMLTKIISEVNLQKQADNFIQELRVKGLKASLNQQYSAFRRSVFVLLPPEELKAMILSIEQAIITVS